ncbi:protein-disulfide reductase DsbD [Oceanospirillum maris]|uniref:protein-disulfide reductase DsbD n=1 Tax=Oceanospirillum maris TaxID=64977 RepID=UPI0004110296|nr:protein-disulfide reductase DsbD [Oceanospirillum maris]
MTFLTFSRPLNHVFNQAIRQAIRLFLICVLVLLSTTSHARSELDRQSEVDTSFLSPEQAFRLESKQTHDGSLTINWKIAPGYYLYQHRVNVTNKQKETINNVVFLSTPEEKDDPNFGLVQVFHHQLTIKVLPLSDQIWLNYQGCSENGLCYPPQRKMLKVNPAKLALAAELTPTVNPTLEDDAGAITTMLIGADGYWVVLTFFILGLGLALTPCVLPMIPILAGIIAGQRENITLRRGIGLSTAYVLGMAVAYTLTGVLVGYFGAQMNLQASLQSPAALVIFSILFVALALAMFGFYELQLPAFLRDRLNLMGKNHRGGKYISVALMGLISALVVSPCVSAPLAGALVYISTTGDAFFGGASLFALSLGMGAPLILVGVGGGQWLPRAGNWMLDVKAFFGVLLLGVAISLLSRLIPGNSTLLLWSLLAMTYAVHLGNFGQLEPLSPWGKTRRGLSIALMVYGICLMLAGLAGQDDPLKPLDFSHASARIQGQSIPFEVKPLFTRYNSVTAIHQAIKQARHKKQPVVVDLYADWCASCKVMERDVFRQPEAQALAQEAAFFQLDITDSTPKQMAFLQQHGLFGPPSLLFYPAETNQKLINRNKENSTQSDETVVRVQGEINLEQFIRHVKAVRSR